MATDKERIAKLEECLETVERDLAAVTAQLATVIEILQQSKGVVTLIKTTAWMAGAIAAVLMLLEQVSKWIKTH